MLAFNFCGLRFTFFGFEAKELKEFFWLLALLAFASKNIAIFGSKATRKLRVACGVIVSCGSMIIIIIIIIVSCGSIIPIIIIIIVSCGSPHRKSI